MAYTMIKCLDPIRVNSEKSAEAAVELQPNGVAFISILNYNQAERINIIPQPSLKIILLIL
jgi:hypothetical protein